MPQVHIPDNLHEKLSEFKQFIEAVLEEPIDLKTSIEIVLNQGIDCMLRDVIEPVDPETLVKSFLQLGAVHPKEVFKFVTETLLRGKEVQERERLKRKIGFHKEN